MKAVAVVVAVAAILALVFAVNVAVVLLAFNGLGVAAWLGLGSLGVKAACGIVLLLMAFGASTNLRGGDRSE